MCAGSFQTRRCEFCQIWKNNFKTSHFIDREILTCTNKIWEISFFPPFCKFVSLFFSLWHLNQAGKRPTPLSIDENKMAIIFPLSRSLKIVLVPLYKIVEAFRPAFFLRRRSRRVRANKIHQNDEGELLFVVERGGWVVQIVPLHKISVKHPEIRTFWQPCGASKH